MTSSGVIQRRTVPEMLQEVSQRIQVSTRRVFAFDSNCVMAFLLSTHEHIDSIVRHLEFCQTRQNVSPS